MKIWTARKTGHGATLEAKDAGVSLHAVKSVDDKQPRDLWKAAICETVPGRRGNGWEYVEGEVTCPRCLKKLARLK